MSVETGVDKSATRQRVVGWLMVLGEFALAQGFGQAAGMLSGLIYVRWMPVEQYGIYALCLMTLSFISVGSDLGINGSLNYFWRRALQDWRPFGPKLAAVRRLRSILFVGALAVGGAVLFTSVGAHPVPAATILLCFGLAGATAFLQTRIGVEIQVLRLEGRQRQSYYCETAGNVVRLVAALSCIITGLHAAWFGLGGGLLGALAIQGAIHYWRGETSRACDAVGAEDWREIRSYLLPLFPSVVVFMIQSPLVYWFAATRNGSTVVAEVFALGRIGAIWSTLGLFTYVVLIPRLSRITDNACFMRVAALCFAGMCALATLAVLAAWLIPDALLMLIGPHYAHLESELLIAMAIASAAILESFLILTARVRGWVRLDPFFALWQLTAIIALCSVWRFDSTSMILELNLAISFSSLTCAIVSFAIGLTRPRLIAAHAI